MRLIEQLKSYNITDSDIVKMVQSWKKGPRDLVYANDCFVMEQLRCFSLGKCITVDQFAQLYDNKNGIVLAGLLKQFQRRICPPIDPLDFKQKKEVKCDAKLIKNVYEIAHELKLEGKALIGVEVLPNDWNNSQFDDLKLPENKQIIDYDDTNDTHFLSKHLKSKTGGDIFKYIILIQHDKIQKIVKIPILKLNPNCQVKQGILSLKFLIESKPLCDKSFALFFSIVNRDNVSVYRYICIRLFFFFFYLLNLKKKIL